MSAASQLLVLGMYPIDVPNKAAAVRIRALLDEFETLMPGRVTAVCGSMRDRSRRLREFRRSGGEKTIDWVYVEPHSTAAGPADLLALRRFHRAGKSIITYIRDAYPMYDSLDLYPGLKGLMVKLTFRISFHVYRTTSQRLGFPSAGLAEGMGFRGVDHLLLPPGTHAMDVPAPPPKGAFLLVGGSAWAANGLDLYVAAARARPDNTFIWCAQPRYSNAVASWDLPGNFRIENWDRDGIIRNLGQVTALVIPRDVTPYMNLAVPIKLMDSLAWARPIVSTRCTETARILADTGSGILVDDTTDGLLQGIDTVVQMGPAELAEYRSRSAAAAQRYSWKALAQKILDALESGAQRGTS